MIAYEDDFFKFDKTTNRYVLTERAIMEKCGVNIRARLEADKTIIPEIVIQTLCTLVSDTIYNFIHSCSVRNCEQDRVIICNDKIRNAVFTAMVYQMNYILANGDMFLSLEESDEGKEIHKMSKQILINSGICYGGV